MTSGRTIGVFSLAPQCANPHFRCPQFSSGHLECYILFALTFARLYLLPCGYGEQTCKKKKREKGMKKSQISASLMWKASTGNSNKFQDRVQSKWIGLERTFPRATPSAGGAHRNEGSSSNGYVFMFSFYLSAYTVLPACLLFQFCRVAHGWNSFNDKDYYLNRLLAMPAVVI